MDKANLEVIFREQGFSDFKWIQSQEIVVAQWVRFRCMFGCPDYGKCGTCPPNVPSVAECREMIKEYNEVAVFHFEKQSEEPVKLKDWKKETVLKLLKLERAVFLAGYYKTLLLPFANCELCVDCSGHRADCKNPKMARPGADALGIDVFATVGKLGYPIQVLKETTATMNRYAFLLIE